MNKQIQIFLISAIILISAGVVYGVFGSVDEQSTGKPILKLSETSYDFGQISMANGVVKHIFTITNDGDADLNLTNLKTSCMCTSVVIRDGNDTSPKFGLHNNPLSYLKKITPGKTVDLEVSFDPNAHGPDAVGQINRVIYLLSNDGGKENQELSFRIFGNVIK